MPAWSTSGVSGTQTEDSEGWAAAADSRSLSAVSCSTFFLLDSAWRASACCTEDQAHLGLLHLEQLCALRQLRLQRLTFLDLGLQRPGGSAHSTKSYTHFSASASFASSAACRSSAAVRMTRRATCSRSSAFWIASRCASAARTFLALRARSSSIPTRTAAGRRCCSTSRSSRRLRATSASSFVICSRRTALGGWSDRARRRRRSAVARMPMHAQCCRLPSDT